MDEARVQAIRSSLEKARRLPAYKAQASVGGDHFCADDDGDEVYWYTLNIGDREWSFNDHELPDFFAAAWNGVPDLLDALEASQAEARRLREALIDVGGTDAAGDNPCWCDGGPDHTHECRQASTALEARSE